MPACQEWVAEEQTLCEKVDVHTRHVCTCTHGTYAHAHCTLHTRHVCTCTLHTRHVCTCTLHTADPREDARPAHIYSANRLACVSAIKTRPCLVAVYAANQCAVRAVHHVCCAVNAKCKGRTGPFGCIPNAEHGFHVRRVKIFDVGCIEANSRRVTLFMCV